MRPRTTPSGSLSSAPFVEDRDCVDCGVDAAESCPASKAECGHHCNHSWTHDTCCWCGKTFEEYGDDAP